MKTMIIAILNDGSRITTEVEVPARKWGETMRQVGQQFAGKQVERAVVIEGRDVYDYGRNEVVEVFGLEG